MDHPSQVSFQPRLRAPAVKALWIALAHLVNVSLENLFQGQVQGSGGLGQIPGDISQPSARCVRSSWWPWASHFFTMSLASPDLPHRPITQLINTSRRR